MYRICLSYFSENRTDCFWNIMSGPKLAPCGTLNLSGYIYVNNSKPIQIVASGSFFSEAEGLIWKKIARKAKNQQYVQHFHSVSLPFKLFFRNLHRLFLKQQSGPKLVPCGTSNFASFRLDYILSTLHKLYELFFTVYRFRWQFVRDAHSTRVSPFSSRNEVNLHKCCDIMNR